MSSVVSGSLRRRAGDVTSRIVDTAKLGLPDTMSVVASDLYELLEGRK
ncbi:hypothetical protein SAMN04490356_5765 [Streptomyces melanosporofaciens]|uniref:Uncharacterized protein n=1 Tax=Streptomyces melanosporofaciens TaxID=67327 RepID=A0A1H4VVR0_STRMJ|nr:hypothetical protein SAMN04490356_5765 [Streptomyces melanosporofaciens]